MRVIAGDIGGTNTRLALCEVEGNTVHLLHHTHYLNANATSLEDHLRAFLANLPAPESACFAVAGPTDGRRVKLTNLGWVIDAEHIATQFKLPQTKLINDFIAVAHGIDSLGEQHTATLQTGHPQAHAPRAILGAGTGLGVTIAPWNGQRHVPIDSEGGHTSFAPFDDEQIALLNFLRAEYKRVSLDRILSGRGIVALYQFRLKESGRPINGDALLNDQLPAAAITQAALNQSNEQAVEAMRLFCRIYGQVAGDLALLAQTMAGVYIAGGIAPKILPLLKHPEFLEGFHTKGRFAEWTRNVPVHVVLDEDVGLKGAALVALARFPEQAPTHRKQRDGMI